jgi:hypothetical protein
MRLLALAAALIRCWTQLYTTGLNRPARDRRFKEVDSDLWESIHDVGEGEEAAALLQLASRFVRGVPADLIWRFETSHRHELRTFAMAAAILAMIVAAWRVIPLTTSDALPTPHPLVNAHERRLPPPPPPPPCRPPAFTSGCRDSLRAP